MPFAFPEAARAVSFDFYNTLVRTGRFGGRGKRYHAYLGSHGIDAAPWQHQTLYDVFGYYADNYDPRDSASRRFEVWVEFTRRLFTHTGVPGTVHPEQHAKAVAEIFGSGALEVFDDSVKVLRAVRQAGYAVAIISNWPPGLEQFCAELLDGAVPDVIVGSAAAGAAKPSAEIFRQAVDRLGARPDEIVHVGDHPVDDAAGARRAGMHAVLVTRPGLKPPRGVVSRAGPPRGEEPDVSGLDDVPRIEGLEPLLRAV